MKHITEDTWIKEAMCGLLINHAQANLHFFLLAFLISGKSSRLWVSIECSWVPSSSDFNSRHSAIWSCLSSLIKLQNHNTYTS